MTIADALSQPQVHASLLFFIIGLALALLFVVIVWYDWCQDARQYDDLAMQYAAVSGGRDVWQAVASWSLVIVGRRVQIVRLRSVARLVTI
ncbi:MAG: hypothetical protein ABI324_28000 [Ktedonobacteraceae bacterium]